MIWTTRSFPQRQALDCHAQILLFGGAAGSLKSETMLMDAMQERGCRGLRAILFRRSYPELEKSLIRRSREVFPSFGAKYNEQKRRWTLPSGATIEFGYCETETDIYRYQGAEFSYVGFDESTHFTEFPIRYMLSRLRTTNPDLKVRLRLATNPGNVGHATHKAIFHGATCTHCYDGPHSRHPYQTYHDALWPSDQHLIGKSTCFIPGRLSDHHLLGGDYASSLASLPGAFRRALLEGCWDVYEGQFFVNWAPLTMSVPRASIPVEDWWPHWVGIDYGFQGSQAAAYLFCKGPATLANPTGTIYVLEEYCARHQPAEDFAREVHRRFLQESPGRKISAWYLSPDAWNQRGDGHTLANQMSEATRVSFQAASTDRVGGAMLIYSSLEKGKLVIAQGCTQLLETIPSRIHDSARPDDIKKISGDPLDDCMDALRYGLYSYAQSARPPRELEIAASMQSPDPTVAMLQRRMAEQRLQKMTAPARYLGPKPGQRF